MASWRVEASVTGAPPPSGRKVTSRGAKSSQSQVPRHVVALMRASQGASWGVMGSLPVNVAWTLPSRVRSAGGGYP